eukprot:5128108-Lingulodinium_polyedra.AAC.1
MEPCCNTKQCFNNNNVEHEHNETTLNHATIEWHELEFIECCTGCCLGAAWVLLGCSLGAA